MENLSEKKRFSIVSRLKSTNHAWRGFMVFLKTTHNAWVHVFFTLLALYLGLILDISSTEWLFLLFAVAIVFITEIINTAIEVDIDLTSPTYHPYARDTKDVAASAVLFAVLVACIVGVVIFLPKILFILM